MYPRQQPYEIGSIIIPILRLRKLALSDNPSYVVLGAVLQSLSFAFLGEESQESGAQLESLLWHQGSEGGEYGPCCKIKAELMIFGG